MPSIGPSFADMDARAAAAEEEVDRFLDVAMERDIYRSALIRIAGIDEDEPATALALCVGTAGLALRGHEITPKLEERMRATVVKEKIRALLESLKEKV